MQDSTLHIKIDPNLDGKLKQLAQHRKKSKGQLVREALTACYQTSFDELPVQQQRAVAAYQGGYISIGKLAREMGMHVLELRAWLTERNMIQQTAYRAEDEAHA